MCCLCDLDKVYSGSLPFVVTMPSSRDDTALEHAIPVELGDGIDVDDGDVYVDVNDGEGYDQTVIAICGTKGISQVVDYYQILFVVDSLI